jgi:type II secretory pathway predicted ATPase ExeA
MYEAFYECSERPFAAAPNAARYFPSNAIEQARQNLARVIERSEGTGLVIGPAGTGKTLLLEVLAAEFRARLATVLLANGRLNTVRALLQAILFELNMPYRHMDESELRLSLVERITRQKSEQAPGLLLLVDEAHSLPLRLLEELRMLTNLTHAGSPQVRLVLAGSSKLEERFASPRLESFAQRLATRCYLESMSHDETLGYVRAQIESVGGRPSNVFEEAALTAVHRATDGIPRLINQVCDHSLLLGFLNGVRPVTAELIEESWADLQQLPAPWNAQPTVRVAGTRVVEFGGLDDTIDEMPDAIPFPSTARPAMASPSTKDFRTVAASPEDQLELLEGHLQELEEDFQPAAAQSTEIELVFRGNGLFGDGFAEEEVVLDRYASLEADLFDRRLVVASREGAELGQMLAQHVRQPAEATLPIRAEIATPDVSQVDDTVLDNILREVEQFDTNQFGTAIAAPTHQTASQPRQDWVAADDQHHYLDDAESDADMIVVEDEPQRTVRHVPAPLVKKQEYRQLFAKLRRG